MQGNAFGNSIQVAILGQQSDSAAEIDNTVFFVLSYYGATSIN